MKTMLKYRVFALKTLLNQKEQLLAEETAYTDNYMPHDAIIGNMEELENIGTFLELSFADQLKVEVTRHFGLRLDIIKMRIENLMVLKRV